jgi:hypothetical protein
VAAAAKYGEESVAECAFERGSRQAAVSFHVTDFGFDGAETMEFGERAQNQMRETAGNPRGSTSLYFLQALLPQPLSDQSLIRIHPKRRRAIPTSPALGLAL